MYRRSLAFILAALMLSASACGGADTPADTTAAPDGTTSAADTERPFYNVDGKNYEGYEFRIWNVDSEKENKWTGIPDDIDTETESGDVLNDAIYRRNLAVEEALNIKIVGTKMTNSKLSTGIQQSIMAGTDEVDAVFPLLRFVSTYVSNGWLVDMHTVDSFDFSGPWWNAEAMESLEIGGRLYAAVSDITHYDKLSANVTFVNSQVVEDYSIGDLPAMVRNGEWTLDAMLKMGEAVSADVDQNGVRDKADAYGISSQNDAVYVLLNSGGMRICDRDKDGNVVFSLTEERSVEALQRIYALITDKSQFFNRQDNSPCTIEDAVEMFTQNRVLFMLRPVQSLFLMRNMQSDFTILPIPKLTAEQDGYHSAVNHWAGNFLCMPLSVKDVERSAVVLSLMACESHYGVTESLYETVLGSKLIRDESSAEMLDIVYDNLFFDTGLIWDFGGIATTLLKNRDTNVASLLAANKSKVDAAIAALHESLEG